MDIQSEAEVLDNGTDAAGTSGGTFTGTVSDRNDHNNNTRNTKEEETSTKLEQFTEIEIVKEDEPPSISQAPHPKPPDGRDGDDVYVAVGKSSSSKDALSWALKNAIKPWSFVYLVHVFPPVTFIPTPLGNMHKSSMRPEEVETYMNQERYKRSEMLQKYQNLCRDFKVKFDVHLIESDQTVVAILELIPVLNIKQLVVGTSKSNWRKMRRAGTKAAQIQKKAPLYCDVKIICEGKKVNLIEDQTPPTSPLTAPVTIRSRSSENTPVSSPNSHENKRNKIKVPMFLRCFSSKNM